MIAWNKIFESEEGAGAGTACYSSSAGQSGENPHTPLSIGGFVAETPLTNPDDEPEKSQSEEKTEEHKPTRLELEEGL